MIRLPTAGVFVSIGPKGGKEPPDSLEHDPISPKIGLCSRVLVVAQFTGKSIPIFQIAL
jgi:hypothetical protein